MHDYFIWITSSCDYDFLASHLNLDGEYITWNDWELINLAFDKEEDGWLLLLVVENIEILKTKDLPFFNRIAKHLYDHFHNDKNTKYRSPLTKIINYSQIGIFDRFSTENFLYDLKKGNIGEFLDQQIKFYKYLYPKYPYLNVKECSGDTSKVYGYEMYFKNKKNRRLLLGQIIDYYMKIFELDNKEVTIMLAEDLEISENIIIKSIDKMDKMDKMDTINKREETKKCVKATNKCLKDLEEDISWLKEISTLVPGEKKYKEVIERQKKIKENPKNARKLYQQSFEK